MESQTNYFTVLARVFVTTHIRPEIVFIDKALRRSCQQKIPSTQPSYFTHTTEWLTDIHKYPGNHIMASYFLSIQGKKIIAEPCKWMVLPFGAEPEHPLLSHL